MEITDQIDRGNIHLKSRIVFPPMASSSAKDGQPSEKTIAHYEAIAKNPLVGLMITEYSYIDVQGKAALKQLSFASDDVIDSQRKLTERIHEVNPLIKIFAQINHAGANTSSAFTGQELVSASDIQFGRSFARALSIEEIHKIEDKFAQAALRVKKAGYDGVEIHSAHGYLLNQFYSPLTNFRSDEYGAQSVENRTRFLCETIKAVKDAVGANYPIAVRLGGCDYIDGGSTIAEAVKASSLIAKAGADLIDLSGGMNGYRRQDNKQPGWFTDMSSAVKEQVSIPVIVTGGIKTKAQAENILQAKKADLIGVGRALFANPDWGF